MNHSRRRPSTLLSLLVALALGLVACGGEDTAGDVTDATELGEDPGTAETEMTTEADPNEGTSPDTDASPPSAVGEDGAVGDVGDDTLAFLQDPSYYLTESPTITGTVQEVSDTGFTLGGEGWQDVSVFVPAMEETLSEVATGEEVTVFGDLFEAQEDELLTIAAQVQDTLGVSLDDATLESLTGGFVLIPEDVVIGETGAGATESVTESP